MNQIIKHKNKYYLKTKTGYREIISSTDESLGLPKPSDSFISKYIEEYNKGEKIENILVEYEKVYPKHFTYNPSENTTINLKVDSNNTITIKKVKDSYSREEVFILLNELSTYLEKEGACIYPTQVLHTITQTFIKNNI